MNTLKKYDLYSHNTMRLHCIADEVFIPESIDEFIACCASFDSEYLILAAGSNIILPKKIQTPVVLLNKIPNQISFSGNSVTCSMSVRIQKLIREAQNKNLGGIEYLFSVPCSIGGAVYMNAGRGEVFKKSISDYITKVECYNIDNKEIEILDNQQCNFKYRHSIFHNNKRLILRVTLDMLPKSKEEIESQIKDRIQHAKSHLDASKPSAGSIFLISDSSIMKRLCGIRVGGACWSKRTENWISNNGNAKQWQVLALIKLAQLLHKLTKKRCIKEVMIW